MPTLLLRPIRQRYAVTTLAWTLTLCLIGHAHAAGTVAEHERLAAAVRQLEVIERLVTREAERPQEERSRYHFDYGRLSTDLERVRTGIHNYLTPPRAQPRDPVELLGDYRQSDYSSDKEEDQ